MTAVAVTGATGAMGSAVRAVIEERPELETALASTRAAAEYPAIAETVVAPSELPDTLDDSIDVLVDFTVPTAAVEAIDAAAAAGVPAVTGTTGFDSEQQGALDKAADDIALLHAPNFSRGIQVLLGTIEDAVAQLPGYDIEVMETHHNRKRDAPSGTANSILDAIKTTRNDATAVHGRSGEAPRSTDEIGVHARRAGSITGEHEVLLAGEHEELRLAHRAESRNVFAAGALDAAEWIVDKPPGWYRFAEVIEA